MYYVFLSDLCYFNLVVIKINKLILNKNALNKQREFLLIN